MPIRIEEPALERRLDALADRQPVSTTKHALARGILERVVDASQDDPEAWLRIGRDPAQPFGPPNGKSDSQSGQREIPANQPHIAGNGETDTQPRP